MKRLIRIQPRHMKRLSGNEYKITDYLLYRSNLKNWKFWVSDMAEETGISQKQVLRLLKKLPFVYQDDHRHYHFDYAKCLKYIEGTPEGEVLMTPREEVDNMSIGEDNMSIESGQDDHELVDKMTTVQEVENKEIQEVSVQATSDLLPEGYYDKKRKASRSSEFKSVFGE